MVDLTDPLVWIAIIAIVGGNLWSWPVEGARSIRIEKHPINS